MTAKELIDTLQSLGEEHQDKQVLVYDEYRYVNIDTVKIIKERDIYMMKNKNLLELINYGTTVISS